MDKSQCCCYNAPALDLASDRRVAMVSDLAKYGVEIEVLAILTDKELVRMNNEYFPSPLMECVNAFLANRCL